MRKWVFRVANILVLLAVGVFVWRAVARHWSALSAAGTPIVSLTVRWIVAAAVTTWLTYLLLIATWSLVLRGWGQNLSYPAAIRIWCLSNLGRYLPGKVWAIAGMAVLAKRRGVDGLAAGASAVVMQGLAVTTGAAIVIATLPVLGSSATPVRPLYVAAAIIIGALGLTLLTVPRFTDAVGRLTGGRFAPRPLALSAVAAGALATLLSWVAYGLGFWFLARGVLSDAGLRFATAVGSFAAAYVVGLIAVFAPGGIGVREGVLFALLAPQLGGQPALVLVAASRLLLTVTEVTAAIAAAIAPATSATNPNDLTGEGTN